MPITYKEILERSLSIDSTGVTNPEEVLWDQDPERVSGVFYPVTEKKPKKKSKSLFKDVLDIKPVVFHPNGSSEDSISISREEYEGLIIYRDQALVSKTYLEITSVVNELISKLDKLANKVNHGKDSVEATKEHLGNSLGTMGDFLL